MKHSQLKNTNQLLSLNKVISVVGATSFVIGVMIIFISAAWPNPESEQTVQFINTDMKTLYTLDAEEKETAYYTRYEINSIIDESAVDFYSRYTHNRYIAKAIMESAIKNDVPVNLAFSVAWKESSYNPNDYNRNAGGSIDRGLFQLNNSYRQNWTKEEFYDIKTNAMEGTRYISEMIKLNDGDYVYALYCYNAGPTRVRVYGTIPESTKQYVTDILEYEDMLTQEFNKWIAGEA